MGTLHLGFRTPGSAAKQSSPIMVALYAASIFVGAALLFLVEPMFARLVLPLLGGSPAVWNTVIVFFQSALLAAYAYAHVSTRWLGVRRQAAWHLLILLAPIAVLPIAIPANWSSPTPTCRRSTASP